MREVDVGQVFQDASVIHGGMAICDFDMAPAFERSKHHEEIGGAVALVLAIETGRASHRHPALYFFGVSNDPPATTAKINPAALSASMRMASNGMPRRSCATLSVSIATKAALTTAAMIT